MLISNESILAFKFQYSRLLNKKRGRPLKSCLSAKDKSQGETTTTTTTTTTFFDNSFTSMPSPELDDDDERVSQSSNETEQIESMRRTWSSSPSELIWTRRTTPLSALERQKKLARERRETHYQALLNEYEKLIGLADTVALQEQILSKSHEEITLLESIFSQCHHSLIAIPFP
jgi:hypothetical protein